MLLGSMLQRMLLVALHLGRQDVCSNEQQQSKFNVKRFLSVIAEAGHCRFQDGEEGAGMVADLAEAMFYYRPEDVLSEAYVYEEWDPSLIQRVGEALSATSDGIRMDLQTSEYQSLSDEFKATFMVRFTIGCIVSLQMRLEREELR
jgi:hypothetical protein